MGLKEPLQGWSDETIERVVNTFIDEKFPTVIALNKIDHPDADKVIPPSRTNLVGHDPPHISIDFMLTPRSFHHRQNIAKIAKQQDPNSIVLCSAISEVFLRRLAKQGYVRYTEGSEFVDTREDLVVDGDPDGGGLKEMDEKLKT